MSMDSDSRRELLARPAPDRIRYFRDYIVAHPVLKDARARLLQIMREPSDGLLVFVLGPSGVGKTTLRYKFQEKVVVDAARRMESDPGHIPVVGVEAVSSDTGKFIWKDYYRRVLGAMDETLIDHKVAYGVRREAAGSGQKTFSYKSTANEHRQAYEQALRHRRPLAVCIDEAQHIAKGASGSSLLSQMDCLKSLANLTETPHVLFGTYALRVFRNLSGQLIRRSVDVHLPRYRAESPSELKVFRGVVKTFQHQLPIHEMPDLEAQWEFLYERSLGCVGTLKGWLCRALSNALEDGGRALTEKHLMRTAIPVSQCEQMLNEIVEGEVALRDDDRAARRLRALLKFDDGGGESPPAVSYAPADDADDGRVQPRKRVRVGTRRPKRDPVGHQEHAA